MTNQELVSSIGKIPKSLPEDSSNWTDISQEVFFTQTIQFVKTYFYQNALQLNL